MDIPDGIYVDNSSLSEGVPEWGESIRLRDAKRRFVIEVGGDFFRESPELSISEYIQSFSLTSAEILGRSAARRGELQGASLRFREPLRQAETLLEYLTCENAGGRGVSITVRAFAPETIESALKISEVETIISSLEFERGFEDNYS